MFGFRAEGSGFQGRKPSSLHGMGMFRPGLFGQRSQIVAKLRVLRAHSKEEQLLQVVGSSVRCYVVGAQEFFDELKIMLRHGKMKPRCQPKRWQHLLA